MTKVKPEVQLGDLVQAKGEKGYFRVLEFIPVHSYYTHYVDGRHPSAHGKAYPGVRLVKVLSQTLKPQTGGHAYEATVLVSACTVIDDTYLMKKEREFAKALDNLVKALEGEL